MLLQENIKGYTTIKFTVGIFCLILLLHSIYKIYTLWDDQQQTLTKIIYLLFSCISCSTMYAFNLVQAILAFVRGARRYNKIRTLKQFKIPQTVEQPVSTKKIKQTKKVQHGHQKQQQHIKKYHSINISQQTSSPKIQESAKSTKNIHKFGRTFSLPNNQTYLSLQTKINNIKTVQIKKNQMQYEKYMHEHNKNIERQGIKINIAKNILGNIYRSQVKKNKENIQELIQKLESLYYIEIVKTRNDGQEKIDAGLQRKTMKFMGQNTQMSNRISFERNHRVSLTEIITNYTNGTLWRNNYILKARAAQDNQYKLKHFKNIQQLIYERIKLDQQINYGTQFNNHQIRLKTIQNIQKSSKYYLENKNIFGFIQIAEQNQIKMLEVWVLMRHINGIVENKLQSAKIYIQANNNNNIDYPIIRWLKTQDQILVHYNQWIYTNTTVRDLTKQCMYCIPGQNNIASLFINYLDVVNQKYRGRLHMIPLIEAYIKNVYIQRIY